jgi:hypothetical protein
MLREWQEKNEAQWIPAGGTGSIAPFQTNIICRFDRRVRRHDGRFIYLRHADRPSKLTQRLRCPFVDDLGTFPGSASRQIPCANALHPKTRPLPVAYCRLPAAGFLAPGPWLTCGSADWLR